MLAHHYGMSGDAATLDAPTPDAVSAEELAAKPEIQAEFQRVFGTPGRSDSRERQRDEEQLEETGEAEVIEESQRDEADGGTEELDSKPQEPADEQDTAPPQDVTLPATLRHAAKRAGWSEDELDQFAASDPDLAVQTLTRLHNSQNDLTMQYARIGQFQNGQQPVGPPTPGQEPQPEQPPAAPPQVPQPAKDLMEEIYGVGAATKLSKFGDDFLEEVLNPMLSHMQRQLRPQQEIIEHYESEKQAQMMGVFEGFLGDLGMEFEDLYGKGSTEQVRQSSEAQYQTREKLTVLADQVRAGAAAQGFDMSLEEALERGHLWLAGPQLEELTRKGIMQQAKSRSSQRTERPTQRRSAPGSVGGDKSIKSAEDAYAERAAELGIDL